MQKSVAGIGKTKQVWRQSVGSIRRLSTITIVRVTSHYTMISRRTIADRIDENLGS